MLDALPGASWAWTCSFRITRLRYWPLNYHSPHHSIYDQTFSVNVRSFYQIYSPSLWFLIGHLYLEFVLLKTPLSCSFLFLICMSEIRTTRLLVSRETTELLIRAKGLLIGHLTQRVLFCFVRFFCNSENISSESDRPLPSGSFAVSLCLLPLWVPQVCLTETLPELKLGRVGWTSRFLLGCVMMRGFVLDVVGRSSPVRSKDQHLDGSKGGLWPFVFLWSLCSLFHVIFVNLRDSQIAVFALKRKGLEWVSLCLTFT